MARRAKRRTAQRSAPSRSRAIFSMNLLCPQRVVPPSDPPTIIMNPVKKLWLSDQVTLANSIATIPIATVAATITKQLFDGVTLTYKFQVIKIFAWGPAGNSRINMFDSNTLREVSDIGNFVQRPRVGLYYPGAAQIIRGNDATGDLVGFNSTDPSAVVDFRVFVVVWAQSTNS